MYIENQASKNRITYINNKPSQDYFDTVQLDYLIDEFAHKRGRDEVIEYLKAKLKEMK